MIKANTKLSVRGNLKLLKNVLSGIQFYFFATLIQQDGFAGSLPRVSRSTILPIATIFSLPIQSESSSNQRGEIIQQPASSYSGDPHVHKK